ncbi:hypothetical protein [Modicisalibacter coralii]|uniref:hypothetical protein n=1 Tax=Modicisalibacter coralii TaxID=2304602 RepID=UPI00100AC546|nr:hypothetical protein [Halomonas coralii]
MSFCRFSSNDWRCDLYIYEGFDGVYMLHVAKNRVAGDVPRAKLTQESLKDGSFAEAHAKQMEYVSRAERVPIGLSADGETFHIHDAEELLAKMRELKAEGYRVPCFAFESVAEDAGIPTGIENLY